MSLPTLILEVRTPEGVLLRQEVNAIRAEDRSGWFGVLPSRADVIAVLPPGLLAFRDAEGEGFVALAGGMLELKHRVCRVITLEATVARELDDLADALARQSQRRRDRAEVHRGVVRDLAREALRRLLREGA